MDNESFSIVAVLSAIDQGFTAGLDAAAAKAKSFSEGSKISMEDIGTGMTVAGAAVTAMGVKSLDSFGKFEASLNQAAVVAGGTAKDIGQLDDLANKMGADLPLSAQDCADAMIEMARNGASIGDIKKQFPAIAQAATAAGSDIKATAGVVQEAMNIWGKSLDSPQQAAAILVQTANASNASVEDMQQALATIGGSAGQAGMSLQVTSEAIGLLTNKGFSAAQASMDLNHAILQMMAPSKVAKDAMSSLGISFTDAQGKMKQFPTILSELNQALNGLNPDEKAQKLKAMFGTAGMQAIVPLLDTVKNKTNDAKVSWDAYAREQDKAAGSTKRASQSLKDQANEMQKNVGSSIEQLGGNWEALRNKSMKSAQDINGASIQNANAMLQWATDSNSATAQFVRGFIGLSPAIGTATTSVGLFLRNAKTIAGTLSGGITGISNFIKVGVGIVQVTSGAKTATAAFGALAESSKLASIAQWAFNSAILANPITWIVVGIAAVVAGLALFFTKTKTGQQMWANFVNWLKNAWQMLVQVAQAVWNAIVQAFSSSVSAAKSAWSGITSFFTGLWQGIVQTAQVVWNGLVAFFRPLVNAIATIWRGLTTVVNNVWRSFVDGMRPVIASIKNLWSALGEFFSTLWSGIVAVAKVAWNGLVVVFRTVYSLSMAVWRPIIAFFSVLWTGIIVVAKVIWNGLVVVFRTIVNIIKAIWTPVKAFFMLLWQGILIVTRVAWNAIRLYISTVFKNIQTVIKTEMNIIKTIFSAGWKILTTIVSAVWKIITTIVSTAINAVAGIIRAITAVIRGDWSGAWNAIKGVAQTVWNGIKSVVQIGINAVETIVRTVMNAVKNVFSSIWNGIKGIFNNNVQFIKSVMHIDLGAQGRAIMDSLLRGLKQAWENVKSFVGGIGNWIKEHKGPLSYDEQLLIPAGLAIMSGLNGGLTNGFSDVQDNVSGMAGIISSQVTNIMDTAQNALDDNRLSIPAINSQQYSESIDRLNGMVQGGNYSQNVTMQESGLQKTNTELLRKIANKDNTMILDDGTLVAKTAPQYDETIGGKINLKDRWSK
ncbi:phage tail tape measure protein [Lactobacillus johnsonii]|uniref:Phage tail tape measure protein n=1 Tax=Lactobacillus johnsonii TaxID=33959 RepID=A0A9X6P157_LACJH|nr:phage tail tape measure protein [Lactobacillus johnsonii]OYS01795.1 phage tail tape measure protein [Lactobacillus johnsonii]OYS07109.1 phage tail tape measure protein [Lactobacillus johnsonii]OYS07692.1 phage tail tape measure protein [Lactobacillus johnsonii]OYS10314.1 phage tail tape measure protein [Lactobacillus johnsonii]OYS11469.1 phage tail tape measure protein [Lactobacillus johnsonii]